MNTKRLDLPSRQYIVQAQRIEFAAEQISEAAPYSKVNIFTLLDWAQEGRIFLLIRYAGEAFSPTRKLEAEKAFKRAVLKALESKEEYFEKNKEAESALVDCLSCFDLSMFSATWHIRAKDFIDELLLAAPMLSRSWLEELGYEAYRWSHHCDLNGHYAIACKDSAALACADNHTINGLLSFDAHYEQTGIARHGQTATVITEAKFSEMFFIPKYLVKRENLYIRQAMVHSIIEMLNSEHQAKQPTAQPEEQPAAQPAEKPKPLARMRYQEQEILRVIHELGYDPLNLPKHSRGKGGVRKQVKEKLSWEGEAFKHAWDRLRADGAIKNIG